VAPPPPKCPCGQQAVGQTCVPLCSAGQKLCGCTSCCGATETCDWLTSTCKSGVG
jgi:hypothetical protein